MKRSFLFMLAAASLVVLPSAHSGPSDTALGLHADGAGWGFHPAAKPEPGLPRVLLVGDSVMNGYSADVARLLVGHANVDTWATGMHLTHEQLLPDLAKVLQQGPYAVVHFNIGLHDWPEGRIPHDQYEPCMQRYVASHASNAPAAKLIWASSTPVTAKGGKSLDPNINPVILRQNEIAARVVTGVGIAIDDLYALGVSNLALARGDQFHWTAEGYRRLAEQVARQIAAALPPPSAATRPAPARSTGARPLELASPDGHVRLWFELSDVGEPRYRVNYHDRVVLESSRLGFGLTNAAPMTRGFRVVLNERTSGDERWRPVAGERAEIRDHYNGLSVTLADDQVPPRQLRLEFRAYDEGVAFRYVLLGVPGAAVRVTDELTEFRFAQDHPCWPVYSAQGTYSHTPLSAVRPGCERPLTVDLQDGRWASVSEAALVDYARMKLQPSGQANGVRANLSGPVTLALPYTTPWRYVLLAESAGGLIERNYLGANLNAPCALQDTSWIQPGSVIREATLTTAGARACVDFAARMGIRYVEFDAGWYGSEYSDASDARAVHLDPKRSKGPLDLQEVIRYGAQHQVGVLLYVNRRALEKQLDELLPLYERWGVKGVKFGFVNVGSQHWTAWLHEAVRKAAAHHLIVDIHDEYRPTGVSRTWPNLLTQEGVRGNEEWPTGAHNLILPFTRLLNGPADCTFCWASPRLKNTRTHQLAASVVLFSPLQFLFWYDRPDEIVEEPALEFWHNLPTTWDDLRVLEGVPGEFLTLARRKGDTWYLGAMNGASARQIDLQLGFLDADRDYDALVCSDAKPPGDGPARVQVEHKSVRRGDRLRVLAFPNGGCAVRLKLGAGPPAEAGTK